MNSKSEYLETKRIYLIVPKIEDISSVLSSISNSIQHLRPWLKWANINPDESFVKNMILNYQSGFLEKRELRYYLWLKPNKDFIGSITLRNLNWEQKTAEIGYWLDKDHIGNGYIKEAVDCLINHAFLELEIEKILAFTYADNARTIKSLENTGFLFYKETLNKESKKVYIFVKERSNNSMNLGLKRNEVKLVPYSKEYSKEFLKVQEEIHQATKIKKEKIQHIGSTAIKNIASKPVIDLLIGVDDLNELKKELFISFKEIGFHRLKVVREKEIILAKFTDETFNVKTHFIHLVDYEGEKWSNFIFFRDYLNSNHVAREEYEKIKLALAESKDANIEDYTNQKEEFVYRICNIKNTSSLDF